MIYTVIDKSPIQDTMNSTSSQKRLRNKTMMTQYASQKHLKPISIDGDSTVNQKTESAGQAYYGDGQATLDEHKPF